MNARTLLTTLMALVAGVVLGWFLSPRPSDSSARGQPIGVAQAGTDEGATASRFDRIEVMIQDLQSRAASASASRRVAEPEQGAEQASLQETQSPELVSLGAGLPTLQEQVLALREQVDAMGKLVDALGKSLADGPLSASLPSLELLKQAREEQDWSQLGQVIEEYTAGKAAGSVVSLVERLRWLSQEDLLRSYGRPTMIHSGGTWVYHRPGETGEGNTIEFSFVRDYVMGVRAY